MESCDRDTVEQWLDGALREYGQAPPMAGLEERILKHLTEQRTAALRPARGLVLASVAALGAVFAMLWVGRPSHPPNQDRLAVAVRSDAEPIESPRKDYEMIRPWQAVSSAPRAVRRRKALLVEVKPTPKLDQFPSPRPLSPEEQMLKRYVREFPEDAASVALEQAKLETEDEKWFAESTRENQSQEEK